MERLTRAITLILLTAMISPVPLWSGDTGKIAGRITDKVTGEPLTAANISIEGTTMGAAANLEGQYTILHVPPGIHSLRVSLIGYSTVTINGVRVYIDQTERVEVALAPEMIEGREVVIVAELPTIKSDVATSVVAVSANEISSLPVTSVVGAIGLQAGIRGGWRLSRRRTLAKLTS